jgi:hypothetical protein
VVPLEAVKLFMMPKASPPHTLQFMNSSLPTGTLSVEVPCRVTRTYPCGRNATTVETVTVATRGVITQAPVTASSVTYGPILPLEPIEPLPPATATCASNPVCYMVGLRTGNCCPAADGTYNACCAFCRLKPACASKAGSNPSAMCCPGVDNTLDECCSL